MLKRTLVLGLAAVGCAAGTANLSEVEQQLRVKEKEVTSLENTLRDREKALEKQQGQIARLSGDLDRAKMPAVSAQPPRSASDLLPASARMGECYAKTYVPESYRSESVRVLKNSASERIEIIPARYETVSERVLVREAYTKVDAIPATYEWAEEKVLVKPAHSVWKKGRGPEEKVDDATGEIMCLVEVPAEYETVRKRVLKTAATTREVTVPAEYKTIQVRKVAEPARSKRIAIPEEYATINRSVKAADSRMEWRPILCETNATPQLVRSLQQSLQAAGHNPGPIDGTIGPRTLGAVKSFQRAKGLPAGGVTIATLDALGVQVGR
ncbi:MAG: peptidoglycan-binding protein [Myxococcales bacterium]|nr:peptidoglycan-binding protein [Myxococcales bacterium]